MEDVLGFSAAKYTLLVSLWKVKVFVSGVPSGDVSVPNLTEVLMRAVVSLESKVCEEPF